MANLIQPHGGLTEPICCMVADGDIETLKAQAASLPKVVVSSADISTVYRIGDGTLSPLTGPMNQAEFNQVLAEMTITRDGKKYAWGIPMSLPITKEVASTLAKGQKAALTNVDGEIIAVLDIEDVFEWDKPLYIKHCYGTERTDHPGADMVLKNDADKTHLLGGKLQVLPQPKNKAFGQYILSPRETRQLVEDKGWDAVVAFQTRNPLHRAHEYAMVYGLETLLREGKNAGAILNPLIGETKSDDVSAEIRMQTYERLIKNRELGDGDSDAALWEKVGGSVPDRVVLLGLDLKMFYGGPREAIMHAIYRQNFGYTHIVIGRKHADAPYADGTAIWGDFDAQEIFENLPGELLISPVKVGFAAYYEAIGRVDLMTNHDGEKPVFISGKQVRATLQQGEQVDSRIMRSSTSEILAQAMKVTANA